LSPCFWRGCGIFPHVEGGDCHALKPRAPDVATLARLITRVGVTMAVPVDRRSSIKLHASTGASTRTGTEFTTLGIFWQYRRGGGL
jgi:hypothetical protein